MTTGIHQLRARVNIFSENQHLALLRITQASSDKIKHEAAFDINMEE